MLVVSFFIMFFGIIGLLCLKHDNVIAKEHIKEISSNRADNIKWFSIQYVADNKLEYDVYNEIKHFFDIKYSGRENRNVGSVIDPEIETCYNISKELSSSESDLKNTYYIEPKPFVDIVLAKKYGKIRQYRNKVGFNKDEYKLVDWIRNNFKFKNLPDLYGIHVYNEQFYNYFWEYSYAFYFNPIYGHDHENVVVEKV